jgi:hypothetical protein
MQRFYGMSLEASQEVIAWFVGDRAQGEAPEAWHEFRNGEANILMYRGVEIGAVIATVNAARQQAGSKEDPGSYRALTFEEVIADFGPVGPPEDTLPDVRRLHALAQAALLRAVTRLADGVEGADDLDRIAQAYLTLPAPHEDGFGGVEDTGADAG